MTLETGAARERRSRAQRDALVAIASGPGADGASLEAAFRRITEIDAHTLGIARVSIWRYTPSRDGIECVDLYDLAGDRHSSGMHLAASRYPAYFRAIAATDVIAVDDAHADSRTCEFSGDYLGPLGITSMMDTAIRAGGEVVGVLCREHVGAPRRWTEDEKTFGVAVANLVSLAVEGWQRRRSEAELRAQRDLLNRAHQALNSHLQNSPLAVIEWDRDFRVLRWSDQAERVFGWRAAEVLGRRPAEWPFVHEDDVAEVENVFRALLVTGGGRNQLTNRNYTRDGRLIHCEWYNSSLVDEAGAIVSILSLVQDVTERVRTDGRLRLQGAALNAAADAIAITDAADRVVWTNPAFGALTGYTALEAFGESLQRLQAPAAPDEPVRREQRAAMRAGLIWRGEVVNRRRDGTLYNAEQTTTPVRDSRGHITHFTTIERDLTERHRLEARILQAQKLETVGRLAGGIAHDFNNLLTVINGTADLAVTQLAADSPLRTDLQYIREAGERAANLTSQLLAFSRKQIMKAEVLSVNRLLLDMRGMLQRLIGEDLELLVRLADDAGNIRADAGQVEQVVLNLVVNARDAMPDGGRLEIETFHAHATDQDTGADSGAASHVVLVVRDTGIGMDAETRSKIFEPFFTTKSADQGTGLGLAMVHGIVTQSGGHITVESAPGEGTTFSLWLPRIEDAVVERRAPRPAAAAPGSETILVVEDEHALRLLAVRILRRAGYTVLAAPDGNAALALLEQHDRPVDLMLTDVVMPGMTGRDLATRLAATHPDMKVLFTSGYTDDAILRHGVLGNEANFIGKPYSVAALTQTIRELLDAPLAAT